MPAWQRPLRELFFATFFATFFIEAFFIEAFFFAVFFRDGAECSMASSWRAGRERVKRCQESRATNGSAGHGYAGLS